MFSIDDEVKTKIKCDFPIGTDCVVKKIWTGDVYCYLAEFEDGTQIQFDEEDMELRV